MPGSLTVEQASKSHQRQFAIMLAPGRKSQGSKANLPDHSFTSKISPDPACSPELEDCGTFHVMPSVPAPRLRYVPRNEGTFLMPLAQWS